jgi:hypothetical protein
MPETFIPKPGQYLRLRRIAAGLTIDDVALRTDTTPVPLSARSRAEWIAAIEAGTAELSPETALALSMVYRFDLAVLDALADLHAGRAAVQPLLCRKCACSWFDPCETECGPCSWVDELASKCSACFDADGTPRAGSPDDPEPDEVPPVNDIGLAGLTLTTAGRAPVQAHAA